MKVLLYDRDTEQLLIGGMVTCGFVWVMVQFVCSADHMRP